MDALKQNKKKTRQLDKLKISILCFTGEMETDRQTDISTNMVPSANFLTSTHFSNTENMLQ